MSEYPEKQFNTESMLEYLKNLGEKDIIGNIPDGSSSIYVNNGKHTVYSEDGVYHGCGLHSGNQECSEGECYSIDGYCGACN